MSDFIGFGAYEEDRRDPPRYIRFRCRSACDEGQTRECSFPINPAGLRLHATKAWTWDGNIEAPTLTPSIDCQSCGWHGFLTKGLLKP